MVLATFASLIVWKSLLMASTAAQELREFSSFLKCLSESRKNLVLDSLQVLQAAFPRRCL